MVEEMMRQLRLVGVHEDGEQLLLSGEDGVSFALRIDEALRSAVVRPIGRPAAGQPAQHLSPREIQARIRAGATAEEVSATSGVPLANVLRYEGPVRAEREFVAEQARAVEVSGPQGHEGYRAAFGEEPANLGEMVAYRLRSFGVEPAAVEWDAWRAPDGTWEVVASFTLSAEDSRTNIGEEPPARWTYHPARKSLQNRNRWAQVLSELEPLDLPLSGRRLTAVADRPFDFEVDADEEALQVQGLDPEELLEVLRARRGQRLGTDEEADDALAILLAQGGIPAAHPRGGSEDDFAEEGARFGFVPTDPEGAEPMDPASMDLAAAELDDDGLPHLYDGVSTRTSEFTVVPGLRALPPHVDDELLDELAENGPQADQDPQPRKQRPKRSSVPSWDEIVFGRKQD
jgi:hypothetical protein